jgi:hypothetical protein
MQPIRLASVILLVLALAVPAAAAGKEAGQQPAADPNAQSLTDFFKNEIVASPRAMDFKVEGGYADIQTETPESSGRYFLASQAIVSVAPDIYKLSLSFKKKYQRDVIDLSPEYFFTQERSYYFWYNGGDRIVLKVGTGRKEFKIQKKELTQIKVKSLETYTIEKTKLGMDMVIPDGKSRIFLQIKFI